MSGRFLCAGRSSDDLGERPLCAISDRSAYVSPNAKDTHEDAPHAPRLKEVLADARNNSQVALTYKCQIPDLTYVKMKSRVCNNLGCGLAGRRQKS